jgi:hypothetical protein
MLLQQHLIEEIKQIPNDKLAEIYDLIHYFRLGLMQEESKKEQKADKVFTLLSQLSDDFMSEDRAQLPLQSTH